MGHLRDFIKSAYPFLESVSPPLSHVVARNLFVTPFNAREKGSDKDLIALARQEELLVAKKRMRVYIFGEGPPVFFAHGWAGRATNFRHLILPLVKSGYQAIAFDAPAHGRSSGFQTHLGEFIEAIGVLQNRFGTPVAVIGHSFGGMAAYLWKVKSGSLSKIILLGSPCSDEELFRGFFSAIGASEKERERLKVWIEKRSGILFSAHFPLTKLALQDPFHLLIVHDTEDKECDIEAIRKLHESNPGSFFYQTEGLGHRRILKSEDVVRVCLEFINPSHK